MRGHDNRGQGLLKVRARARGDIRRERRGKPARVAVLPRATPEKKMGADGEIVYQFFLENLGEGECGCNNDGYQNVGKRHKGVRPNNVDGRARREQQRKKPDVAIVLAKVPRKENFRVCRGYGEPVSIVPSAESAHVFDDAHIY